MGEKLCTNSLQKDIKSLHSSAKFNTQMDKQHTIHICTWNITANEAGCVTGYAWLDRGYIP